MSVNLDREPLCHTHRALIPNRFDTGGFRTRLRCAGSPAPDSSTGCAGGRSEPDAQLDGGAPWVSSSGIRTAGRHSAASNSARIAASTSSVLTFASAIPRPHRVRNHDPRDPRTDQLHDRACARRTWLFGTAGCEPRRRSVIDVDLSPQRQLWRVGGDDGLVPVSVQRDHGDEPALLEERVFMP